MRQIVRSGPLGERGLQRIFNNFDGRMVVDPSIPGVEKTTRLLASSNPSQVKGHTRELLYAIRLHNDGRNELVAMGRRLERPWGNTDADLVIRNRQTGLFGRIEVKDYSLQSQITNKKRLKNQMRKMALEGKRTGEPQFWINRREVSTELRQYGQRSGIVILERVATGQKLPPHAQSFDSALARIDRHFAQTASHRALIGGAMFGAGYSLLSSSLPEALRSGQELLASSAAGKDTLLNFTSSSFYSLGGAGWLASGTALNFAPGFGETAQKHLFRFGRIGGLTSTVAVVSGMTIDIARYVSGDLSSERLWNRAIRSSAMATIAVAGGVAGGAAGTVLSPGNPLAITGGAIGGSTGALAVADATEKLIMEKRLNSERRRLDHAHGSAVSAQYGVPM